MSKRMRLPFSFLLAAILLAVLASSAASAQAPVVNAVLFYSPTCPHCHEVMTEDLPPLKEQFGDQLAILEVNVTSQQGQELYQQALREFNVTEDRLGVPALAVGDNYLVGADEIPNLFPSIITSGLEAGGLEWPTLGGLQDYITRYGLSGSASQSLTEKFMRDPVGNTISTLFFLGMGASVIFLVWSYLSGSIPYGPWPRWILPVLIAIGIAVSGYMTYVEFTQNEAVCGPIGDCNAVQSSVYAYVFGVIPVAVLGLLGYLGMAAALAISYLSKGDRSQNAAHVLWWLALFGVAFSTYLTYLEPFVIGATCAWCLASAASVTAILWGSAPLVLSRSKKVKSQKAARRARPGPIR